MSELNQKRPMKLKKMSLYFWFFLAFGKWKILKGLILFDCAMIYFSFSQSFGISHPEIKNYQ